MDALLHPDFSQFHSAFFASVRLWSRGDGRSEAVGLARLPKPPLHTLVDMAGVGEHN